MDFIVILLSLFVITLALAIFSNRARARKEIHFELQPNCLLTRWPLVFVTGPRSFFYFDKYWNQYTSFLAEHGYEVFNVRLPWNKTTLRKERFKEFLKQQEQARQKFHLFLDSPTFAEMEDLLRNHNGTCLISVTEISDAGKSHPSSSLKPFPFPVGLIELNPDGKASFFTKLSYTLHLASLTRYRLLSLSSLGAAPETFLTNAKMLLERAHDLAETDLRSE